MVGRTDRPDDLPYVDADADELARLAVDRLVGDLQRRELAYVATTASDPRGGYGIAVRLHRALVDQAEAAGARLAAEFAGRTATEIADGVGRLLVGAPDVDGVLAFGDVVLGGCLAGAAAAGRAVPDDVAVVGLLTTDFVAELVNPPATTVSSPPVELGRRAAAAIVGFLGDGRVDQLLLRPELTVRRSG
jgi:DNA-binding LacI/PurR family transcriptional regulator